MTHVSEELLQYKPGPWSQAYCLRHGKENSAISCRSTAIEVLVFSRPGELLSFWNSNNIFTTCVYNCWLNMHVLLILEGFPFPACSNDSFCLLLLRVLEATIPDMDHIIQTPRCICRTLHRRKAGIVWAMILKRKLTPHTALRDIPNLNLCP